MRRQVSARKMAEIRPHGPVPQCRVQVQARNGARRNHRLALCLSANRGLDPISPPLRNWCLSQGLPSDQSWGFRLPPAPEHPPPKTSGQKMFYEPDRKFLCRKGRLCGCCPAPSAKIVKNPTRERGKSTQWLENVMRLGLSSLPREPRQR